MHFPIKVPETYKLRYVTDCSHEFLADEMRLTFGSFLPYFAVLVIKVLCAVISQSACFCC